jgi:membrane-associated phospholipid phosphatase
MWDFMYRNYKFSRLSKYVSLSLAVALMLIIGASRIYNGIHTYN